VVFDQSDVAELKRDRSSLRQIAAAFGEGGADFARRAVAVVGQRLDDDGDAARPVALGSGRPSFAATVISRASLLNSFDRAASWRPLRCMMFLNCECPAMVAL
jgi:hypothetical protein